MSELVKCGCCGYEVEIEKSYCPACGNVMPIVADAESEEVET